MIFASYFPFVAKSCANKPRDSSMEKKYRLIWFHHFHKAAGSSIVKTALANKEKPFPKHENGNPCDEHGELLPLENYNSQELRSFIDSCEQMGVTFVACEWDVVNYSILEKDPRVTLITCIRSPLHRFLSNYYYGFYRGHHDDDNFEIHLERKSKTFQNDYYCRMFSRKQKTVELTNEDFNKVKNLLSLFNIVCVLEKEGSLEMLSQALGWNPELAQYANKTGCKRSRAIRYFFKGKSYLTKRHTTHPQVKPSEDFKQLFTEQNPWETELYRWALENTKQ